MNLIRLVGSLTVLALALSVAACTANTSTSGKNPDATGEQPPDAAVDLVRTGACGDAFFWAETAAGDTAVTVDVVYSRPAEATPTVGIPFTHPGSQVVNVRVVTGQDLSRNFCTDLPATSSEPKSTSPATAGEGRVTIAPTPRHGAGCGRTLGTLVLRGLVAENGTEFLPITVQSTDIGCYAR